MSYLSGIIRVSFVVGVLGLSATMVLAESEPRFSLKHAKELLKGVGDIIQSPGLSKEDMKSIKVISDREFEIPSSLRTKVFVSLPMLVKEARVKHLPNTKKNWGFLLTKIKPESVYNKLGFRVGDTVRSVNGVELRTKQDTVTAFYSQRVATSYKVEIMRNGKVRTHHYRLT